MLRKFETRRLVQYESCAHECGLNESVCNSRQKWDHDECQCKCKELDDKGSCKNNYLWNSSTCDCECNKAHTIDEYLDIKNCSCKKHDKLLDEILNTTETSLDNKKATCEKNNCLIDTISLVIIGLLLLVAISVSYYYYTRY